MAVAAPAAMGDATVHTARRWPVAALVALTVILTFESFRILFPHLYGLKEREGLMTVLIALLAVAVAPFLGPLLARLLKPHRAVVLGALLLGAWRLVVQFVDPIGAVTAIAGAIVALLALTLVLSAPLPGGSGARATGLLAGFALDVAILGAFITWEPAWQDGVAADVVGALLAASLMAAAFLSYRDAPAAGTGGASPAFSGGIAVGAILALEFMFLASSAFLSAASGLALGLAIAVATAGAAAALALVSAFPNAGRVVAAGGAGVLTAAGFLLPKATGALALVLLLAAQLGAGFVLGRALAPGGKGPGRAGLGLAVGWLVALVGILLYQLHFDSPLPVDNAYATALLGLLAFVAVVGGRAAPEPAARRPGIVIAVALLALGAVVGVGVASFAPDVTAEAPDGAFVVVQWNVHQGIDENGRLDPETPAAVLDSTMREAEGKAVVVLNEVARGWPASGQLDLATWMSYRLGMRMVWGAASGPEFGNVILTRFAVTDSEVVTLTHWDGYQGRSLVEATVDLGGGRAVAVLGTHLQHRNTDEAHAARLTEIDEILEHWAGAGATVLAGDLNPKQGDPPEYPPRVPGQFEEIARLLAAGFTTAQNLEACEPPTSNDNCSDYILAGPGLSQASFQVGPNFGDHRMLVAEVTGR
jgi:endonuclease/exonuclease/phosphatase family metal-dependent hydrolase